MQPALLTTKLYFPTVCPVLVPRPRLVERLQAGLCSPLTLISAPAGSGKTTLLSEWRDGPGSGVPVAWVSLEMSDNDLSRFFQYLGAALDQVQPGIAEEAASLLQPSEQPNAEAILTLLANTLDTVPQDFALVLDDYHVIETTAIHEALTFLLNHLPPCMHLVLLTRSDPPLPLSRLRARGHLTEIRAADLRFNVEETTKFLNRVMGLDLTGDQVAALERRTEGWIAGLQLAALSMQGRGDVDSFVSAFTGSNHYIVDYLADEVLNRQPDPLREFLLKTSILERLTGSLCDAVTGNNDGSEVLERLERSNLFLIPLDDSGSWYRYHHLFADVLQKHLRYLYKEHLPEIHRRAAGWFQENGSWEDAFRHWVAGGEPATAANLMEQQALSVLSRGDISTLQRWLGLLPPKIIQQRPWLCVFSAWVYLLNWDLPRVKKLLEQAEAGQARTVELGRNPHFDGHLLAIRAYLSGIEREDERSFELCQQALALLPAEAVYLRGSLTYMTAVLHLRAGRLDQVLVKAKETRQIFQEEEALSLFIPAQALIGIAQIFLGDLKQAQATYRQALERAEQSGHFFPVDATALLGLSEIHYEWNELEQAESLLLQAGELSTRWGNLENVVISKTALATLRLAQGDRVGAEQELEDVLHQIPEAIKGGRIAMARARLLMEKRQADAAEAVLIEAGIEPTASINFNNMGEQSWLARVYLGQGRLDEADRLIQCLEEFLNGKELPGARINIQKLRCLELHARKQMEDALDELEDCLRLAEPGGYLRAFVDEGEPMRALLGALKRRREKRPQNPGGERLATYLERLLAAFQTPLRIHHTGAILSSREFELLSLISAGRSNMEIATELVISLGTVKRHTFNIFNKLDVKNRTEAVSKARELGLL
jgi:LuxR family maltose regulon positive regulatory protein